MKQIGTGGGWEARHLPWSAVMDRGIEVLNQEAWKSEKVEVGETGRGLAWESASRVYSADSFFVCSGKKSWIFEPQFPRL